MLDVTLFFVELYILAYTAVHQWQRHGRIREAVLAVGLSAFAFVIVWAIASPLVRLAAPSIPQGIAVGPDSLGVVVTVAIHLAFVRAYFFAGRRFLSSRETMQ
ncbi:MAG: hypothetical protein D6747_02975 [Chlorobiota bacterium]|jgi:hypothetical protein|nr:MAG: hypothetical protein D6747_02975 [Chlorobiota bacterium]